jgi:hypothetical protein
MHNITSKNKDHKSLPSSSGIFDLRGLRFLIQYLTSKDYTGIKENMQGNGGVSSFQKLEDMRKYK